MSTLNIQPPRVPLTNPQTGEITREWYRYITDSFKRQGGTEALTNTDLEQLASQPSNVDPQIFQSLDIVSRLDELQQSIASLNSLYEMVAVLQQTIHDVEQIAGYRDPFRVDWERPGKIGSLTASTIRGTTIESTASTGTAPLIIASTTKVANLNADLLDGADWAAPAAIGTGTPAAGTFTTVTSSNGDIKATNGDFSIETAGKGLRIKTAANARAGQSTLVAGTVTVNNTSVTANTRVLALTQTAGGTPGYVYKSAVVAGTSFTLTSTSAADTSTVFWFLIEIQ